MNNTAKNVEKVRTDLKPAQIASLELLKTADEICRSNAINYTLLNYALWGAEEYNGFIPWDPNLQIGMFYEDFVKFIDICKKRFEGTDFYIIDSENCEQFEELYIRIAKRSRVVLSEDRKKDEKYYDYTLDVFPIYYAGNTKKELKSLQKEFHFLFRCIHTGKSAPGFLKLSNCIKKAKQAYYHHHRKNDSYDKIKALLLKNNTPSKYVLVPYGKRSKGCVYLASTYKDLQECSFEGHNVVTLRNAQQWLFDYYGLKLMEELKKRPVNQAVLEGPETLRRVQLIELEILKELDRICRKYDIKYNLGAGTLLGAVRHKGFIPWDDDIDVFMIYDDYQRFLEVAEKELDSVKYFIKTQDTDPDCNLTYVQIKRNGTKYSKGKREKFNTHPGILIDILPFFNAPKTAIGHYLQQKICQFYKTMTWAHIGANSERKFLKRKYYEMLARTSNKESFKKFMKFATMIKTKSDKLSYFYIGRNFHNIPLNLRKNHEELVEMEFEGYPFFVARDWDTCLKFCYSDEYLRYPGVAGRRPNHLPAVIDVGDLYSYDNINQE